MCDDPRLAKRQDIDPRDLQKRPHPFPETVPTGFRFLRERVSRETQQAKKFDDDKPRTDLVPPSAITAAAEVFAFGAKKYGDRNWEQGLSYGRLYGAILRHLLAWWAGQELDPESGLPHLGHALCSLMMLHDTQIDPPSDSLDDRPSPRAQLS